MVQPLVDNILIMPEKIEENTLLHIPLQIISPVFILILIRGSYNILYGFDVDRHGAFFELFLYVAIIQLHNLVNA